MKAGIYMRYITNNTASTLQVSKQQQLASGNLFKMNKNAYNWPILAIAAMKVGVHTIPTTRHKHNKCVNNNKWPQAIIFLRAYNLKCNVQQKKERRQVNEKSFDLKEGIIIGMV